MKTVQQIMQETGAKANIRNFRYMQENYTYKQKIRHAENVARSYQDKCSEMGLNCHVSVGGLDSITLHYFLETCGVHVPCVSCSSLEQKGVQAVHKQIAAEMENTYSAREWLGAHMALPQDEIDTITDPDTRAQEQALHDACPPVPRMYFLKPLKPKTNVRQPAPVSTPTPRAKPPTPTPRLPPSPCPRWLTVRSRPTRQTMPPPPR